MFILRYFKLAIFLVAALPLFSQTSAVHSTGTANWSVDPFVNKVFIENKGQFDPIDNGSVFYGVRNEGVEIYFTSSGLAYHRNEPIKIDEEEIRESKDKHEEQEDKFKTIPYFVYMNWEGANPNPQIIAEEPVSRYFTYGDLRDHSGATGFKASAYKKITYKNVYRGIDVVYTFPEDKKGIKYSFILHPGADPSQIKMNYKGAKLKNKKGSVLLETPFGIIEDHAPVSMDEKNVPVASSFILNKNTVSFRVGAYDKTHQLIIDPWTIVPAFAFTNSAFDVDYDQYGNVYVYGGTAPYQLIKLNNAGTVLWTYTANVLFTGSDYYGDFAVDRKSGSAYMIQGFNFGAAASSVKVNASGTQVAVNGGSVQLAEMWRISYNSCTKKLVVAGGGTLQLCQGAILDTTMTKITPVNVLGATVPLLDFALLCSDNSGNAYMATARSFINSTYFDNKLLKVPVPALTPMNWQVSDGYAFLETASIPYVGSFGNYPNGFNGMTANTNNLYTYDGSVIKKWNTATGAQTGNVTASPMSFHYGGLSVDECDHLYAGVGKTIKQYDVGLNLISTTPAQDTVYDLVLSDKNIIYACGLGFVSSINAPSPICQAPLTLSFKATPSCANNGTALVTPTGGVGPYTYAWSTTPVQTKALSTGLAVGQYTVTVKDASCPQKIKVDSVIIKPSTFTEWDTTMNASCSKKVGEIQVKPTGGIGNYTYSWSTTPTKTTSTIDSLAAGTYSVTITDSLGCTITKTFTVLMIGTAPKADFLMTPTSTTINDPTIVFTDKSSGVVTTWLWNFGDTATSFTSTQNASHTYGTPGTYSVKLVVSGNGCSDSIVEIMIVLDGYGFYVPDAFSPNGDGKNENFGGIGAGFDLSSYEMWIFDRWGNEIYHTTDYNKPWNGKANGGRELAQEDVYVWKIQVTDLSGQQHKYRGHVTMVK